MKITVSTIFHNEEDILPYFIHHYAPIADQINLINNESTDNSVEIAKETAKKLGFDNLKIIFFKSDGYDDYTLINAKRSSVIKDTDYMIVVDTDEFIHHREGKTREFLEYQFNHSEPILRPRGFQMLADEFPKYAGVPMTELVKHGARDEGFDKPVIFNPAEGEWRPSLGSHVAALIDKEGRSINFNQPPEKELYLLHYKMLGFEHRLKRIHTLRDRLNDLGKSHVKQGIAIQLMSSEEGLRSEYESFQARKELVL